MKKFYAEYFFNDETLGKNKKILLSFSSFELSFHFVSYVEENEFPNKLAKILIPLEYPVNIKSIDVPFFENLDDAKQFIMMLSLKSGIDIKKSEFDELKESIISRQKNNEKEIAFRNKMKDSLRIIHFCHVNDLDTETYELLCNTITECAEKFSIDIKEDE